MHYKFSRRLACSCCCAHASHSAHMPYVRVVRTYYVHDRRDSWWRVMMNDELIVVRSLPFLYCVAIFQLICCFCLKMHITPARTLPFPGGRSHLVRPTLTSLSAPPRRSALSLGLSGGAARALRWAMRRGRAGSGLLVYWCVTPRHAPRRCNVLLLHIPCLGTLLYVNILIQYYILSNTTLYIIITATTIGYCYWYVIRYYIYYLCVGTQLAFLTTNFK